MRQNALGSKTFVVTVLWACLASFGCGDDSEESKNSVDGGVPEGSTVDDGGTGDGEGTDGGDAHPDAGTDGAAGDGSPDAPSSGLTVTGLGGGGGLFLPAVSPYDENLMFLSCDMGGSYRSHNGGGRWDMIHHSQISGTAASTYPAFLPSKVLWHKDASVRLSQDGGTTWQQVASMPWGQEVPTYLGAVTGPPEAWFVSTAAGLWRSQDDGSSWSKVIPTATREVLEVGDMLYTVAGEGKRELHVSEDLGATWTTRGITVGGAALGSEVVSFTGGASAGSSVLFASVLNMGIIRSTDEGTNWTLVMSGYDDQTNLQMASHQTTKVYAAQTRDADGSSCGSSCTKVWRSIDGGASWQETFHLTGTDANVEPAWVQTELKWGYFITRNGFHASRSDADFVMVSTQGDFYVSRDGGTSWTPNINESLGVLSGDPSPRYRSIGLEVTSSWGYLFDPFEPGHEFIAYTDIGFARSIDSASTWSWSAKGCPWLNTFYDVVFDPEVSGRMYAAASSRHDIPHWNHVSPNTSSHRGGVCISDDRARTWASKSHGLPERPATTIALDPTSPKESRTLWVGMFGEGIFKSTDGGATWTSTSTGLGNASGGTTNLHVYRVRRHPGTGSLFALITARREGSSFEIPGGVWKSADGGEHWVGITASNLLFWPTDLALHPGDEDTLYVTAATAPGKAQGGVWKTSDGGASWSHVLDDATMASSGGPSYDHVMAVTLHPDDASRVFAGTTMHGLWYSVDGGETWEMDARLPFASAQSITVHPQDHDKLYVTTFGGGVWTVPWPPP